MPGKFTFTSAELILDKKNLFYGFHALSDGLLDDYCSLFALSWWLPSRYLDLPTYDGGLFAEAPDSLSIVSF